MKALLSLAGTILVAYVAIGLYLYIFQRGFIYFPTAEVMHSFQTEEFSVNNETIKVIVLNEGNNSAIMYFGGNAENVVAEADAFTKTFPPHTVYLISYRGYSGSSGQPTEKGLYADAQAIYDTLSGRHQSISAIGRSLGSGVVTFLASNRELDKIVLVTPFDSAQHIAQDTYPIYPMSLLLKDKYDSIGRVKEINSPVLVVIADKDWVIPLKYQQKLVDAFPPSQVAVKVIKGAGHNSVSLNNEYYVVLQEFLKGY